ncbi:MAG: efflux transporter outer membrane subunit [Burkholderiales bacterium]|nr:efflux transporter outer membrane subunit [Burkholderiales bacterium]
MFGRSKQQPNRTGLSVGVAVALALVVSGGCTMIPTYERPAAPVADAYPAGEAVGEAASGAVAAADIGWRDFIGDARLQRLIELALNNNRDLRVAALGIEQYRAQYRIQRSVLFPTVDATGTLTRQEIPAGASIINRGFRLNQESISVGFTSYELDLFGRIRSLKEQALEQYFASEAARKSTQISLVAEITAQYLSLLANEELLRLTEETLATRQKSYDLTRRTVELGQASAQDLRQSETLLETAKASLARYTRQVAQDTNGLVVLIGSPLPADLPAAVPFSQQRFLADLPAGLPSDLLQRRPDIEQAEHVLKGANANIGAARAAFFPRISLTANLGTASSSLDGLFKSGSEAWTFTPQISLPIFNAGSNRAKLDVAKLQKEIEIAQYEKTIQTAFREVADALAARGTYDSQVAADEANLAASREYFRLAEARYTRGVDNFLIVLDAQRSLYAAEQTLINDRLARLTNLVTLYKVLGGGWNETTVSSAEEATQPGS